MKTVIATMMNRHLSPAARSLLDLRADQCRWPSRHHLDDERFSWCSALTLPGKSYCQVHQARAYAGEDTASLDEIIEVDAGARYRIVVARGRNLGDKRQWKVVPVGAGKPQRRGCGIGKAESYPTTGQAEETHHARAPRAADAGDGHLPGGG
jgi:hypothetical protein